MSNIQKIENMDVTEIIKQDKIQRLLEGDKRARLENFQKLVQVNPKQHSVLKDYIKEHPIAGNDYLPIGVKQMLLDQIFFGLWNTKNVQTKQILNEVCCTLELEVYHPVQEIWITRTGAGAVPIQQKKNKDGSTPSPADIDMKYTRALEKDFPHAEANAFSNACGKLGKIFGRDLGRDAAQTLSEYQGMISDEKVQNMHKSLADLIEQENGDEDE